MFTRNLKLGFGLMALGLAIMFAFRSVSPGMIVLGIVLGFTGLGLVIYEGIRE